MGRENAGASNALATLGAVCWGLQLVPQIYKSWKRKDTQGLSTLMLAVWFVSGVFLGSYCITSDLSIPLIIQPQAFCFFSSIAWSQCLHYHSNWSRKASITVVFLSWAVGGAVEAGLVFGCKALQDRGNEKMNLALGIIAAVFVAGGLLPQYYEVWKYQAVIGISLIFLFIDLCGGVFSALSLIFSPPPFDILASISYGCVVVLEIGIFLLVPVLNPRYYRRQREKAEEEKTVTQETTGKEEGRNETMETVEAEGPLGWMGKPYEGLIEEGRTTSPST
ncbi:hypothetical protein JCM5350_000338 [Sporobolomyces pararoseus]